ncbi:uncharacterized protein FIBRA_01511 [Fibroporia radiculosa]|uniref:Polyketide synthase phosphopantetheine-binding domain-containing protein n=1 Tax=Fibroporia radiculosa TaxID=599839 RepID=J4G111_9APHY|nr:uncharacterized protein FIBRA_01511 [Fibroporia radiculosa]CCL99493.1 predicted protein [Fibroporia radiculosa]
MVMGIIRASYSAFVISARNSPAAVAHLLNKVGVNYVLVGNQQASQDLAKEALRLFQSQNPASDVPGILPMPAYADLYSSSSEYPSVHDLPVSPPDLDAPALILHSSGSTAFPKPITYTNRRMIEIGSIPYYGEIDVAGLVFSLHMLPMFHGIGLMSIMWATTSGITVSLFAPRSPPLFPTVETVFQAAKATNCDVVVAAPAFLESWSRVPECVSWFTTRKYIWFGGGPLNKEVGDFLLSQGVPLCMGYGQTETGIVSIFLPAKIHPDWEYIKFQRRVTTHMLPQGDNTFELVIVSNEQDHPCLINTQVDGVDAYTTSDRLSPHPSLAGYWRIVGRTDDLIMHSTGEKTIPGPLESILMQDEHVAGCVMFGRGRFQTGILVDPKPQYAFDPVDEDKLVHYRNIIWPTVEKMNAYAPQHSRLFKEMILVTSPGKPFEHTAKSTIRRAAVIAKYDDEINAAYDRVEESSQSNIPAPVNWDTDNARSFVRAVVHKVLNHKVKDEDDVFNHGCDSLQAAWIRNTLLRALRDTTKANVRNITGNFVYERPTIAQLTKFIANVALGSVGSTTANIPAHIDAMHVMVAKYTKDLPRRGINVAVSARGDVVLLTGSTGGLGCYILAQTLADPKVSRVFAFNRSSRDGVTLQERQRSVLVARGLPDLVSSEKLTLVEGELADENLGISDELYKEMLQSVTHIVHNGALLPLIIASLWPSDLP